MKSETKSTFAESAIWLGAAVLILIYGVVILLAKSSYSSSFQYCCDRTLWYHP